MSALRFIGNRHHDKPRTHLTDCPAGHVRVAIFTPAGDLAQTKFGEVIGGRVFVTLFGRRTEAAPCELVPGAGARYSVTMPAREE